MSATIIDGKALALKVKDELKLKVEDFKNKYNREISLAVVLVGDNSASEVYVRNKIKACEYVGVKSLAYYLPKEASENEVLELVESLANDDKIDGILTQLPLPKEINEEKILKAIPTEKDVDGFSSENVGNLMLGKETTVACTPFGVLKMLKEYNIPIAGKNAVVLGRSNIVGKPMAMLLLAENATVTICHSKTQNLKEITKNADIIVAAIGKAKFLTADMVKNGAVVIDVGMDRDENGKLCGDVDYENVSLVASYITPVPGGVGPMTIAMLLENTYLTAIRREKR